MWTGVLVEGVSPDRLEGWEPAAVVPFGRGQPDTTWARNAQATTSTRLRAPIFACTDAR